MRDMYEVLDRWGAWAAADNSGVDWKPIAVGFKGMIPYGKNNRSICTDDEGMKIDMCVARLKGYRREHCDLIIAHFVYGFSQRSIAR